VASSTVPAGSKAPTARHARRDTAEDRNYGGQDQNYAGDYSEPVRERPRENTTTAAAAAARTRRQGPTNPEAPHQSAGTRDRGQQSDTVTQGGSEAAAVNNSAPPPLMRENSEVINRLVISDPQVDAERLQERVAEAIPTPVGSDVTPVTGLGLVGSEGVDDGGRGGARRQDYSRSTSRRKDVQFGEYMLGQTLGEGEFGSMQVAIKLIRRETVATNPSRLPKIYREISILRDLAHPNIVRLHEMVETERHIGIILEYASGGELFDYILNHRYLKDQAARRLFAQLVSGVGYLHKKGIVHRDLKLENLLLDQNRNIIITDFGFANTFNPADELSDEIEYNLSNREFVRKYRLDRQDENGMRKGDLMQTSCGSPCYAAPELVVSDSLYTGRKVDVWSCGVILVSTRIFLALEL
jgi:protein-serine/threonine kinase